MPFRFALRRCHMALLLASASLAAAPLKAQDNTGEEASATVSQRQKMITKELASAHVDEWSGEYYYGDGLGVNVRLFIGQSSGFVFTWYGCLGLYDQNYGEVRHEGGRLQLIPKLPNDRSQGFQGIAEDFYPIRWGARHYLVPVGDMVKFTNAVNSGSEPRASNFSSRFLLKRGDQKKKVRGAPPIPPEYADYLLKSPLEAHILSVGTTRMQNDERVDLVTLNIGSEEGVRREMEFFVIDPVYGIGRVTKVSEHTCELELTQYNLKPIEPSLMWKLSTRLFTDSGW